ncbi:unnamed protein product, partial [Prorocentrum cordatum]
ADCTIVVVPGFATVKPPTSTRPPRAARARPPRQGQEGGGEERTCTNSERGGVRRPGGPWADPGRRRRRPARARGADSAGGPRRTSRALAHLAALLLQAAGALLLPLPPEHRPGLLVRVRLVSHGRGRRRLL